MDQHLHLDHDHEHGDHPHTHDHVEEVDALDQAYQPPAEELLMQLREQWLTDRSLLTAVHEELLVAKSTIEFQNKIIAALQEQLAGGNLIES